MKQSMTIRKKKKNFAETYFRASTESKLFAESYFRENGQNPRKFIHAKIYLPNIGNTKMLLRSS